MSPRRVVVESSSRVREGWQQFQRRWRHSLRFRTVTLTLMITAGAIMLTFVTMAVAIQNDLFESRKAQVLGDAQRAANSAQATLDAAEISDDHTALQAVWRSVRADIAQMSSSNLIAAFRIETGPVGSGLTDFTATGFDPGVLTPALRTRVIDSPDRQWWQSVALPNGSSVVPGIVIGQQLRVPTVGGYELYIAYDLAAASETLMFVQRALWVAGVILLLIIAGISWFVLRSVTGPIINAAETSARLASGDLGVRLAVHGEDELATLGQSFNAMADSIQHQIKALADLSLVQQRFVSDVSHELRTPLTTIRLAADMLSDQRHTFEPTTARTAELLHTQVQRFETLLSDLLEISRYDAGSVQLEYEASSLAQLAEEIIDQMQPLAHSRGSEISLDAPGGYSPVEMDPRRIRRIVRNLVGNAIEHGEGKPIVITVDSDAQAVALGVRDYGLGMDPVAVQRVFDRFWRADPSRKRTLGGTGLGLSIALGDARLHSGTIEVWSEPNLGSNFVLVLPRSINSGLLSSPVAVAPDPAEPQPTLTQSILTQPVPVQQATTATIDRPPGALIQTGPMDTRLEKGYQNDFSDVDQATPAVGAISYEGPASDSDPR